MAYKTTFYDGLERRYGFGCVGHGGLALPLRRQRAGTREERPMPVRFRLEVEGHTGDKSVDRSPSRFWITVALAVVGILATVYFGLR